MSAVGLAAALRLAVLAAIGLPPAVVAATPHEATARGTQAPVAASRTASDAPQRQMSPLGLLPASFAGELPGAGGPVRWQIDLLPGGRYQLRQTYPNRPEPNRFDDLGRYTLEGRRLTLLGGRDAPVQLELQDDGALRMLDRQGRPIPSSHAGLLSRMAVAAPIEPRLKLTALFTYFAAAPRAVLCADGRALPVAMAGDYAALARAHDSARSAPGAPVWVELDGLVASRPAADASQAAQDTLVVERFVRIDPPRRCEGPMADRPLLGTDWRMPVAGSRAGIRFDAGRVMGNDGCNRLVGTATVDGNALRIGPLAGTRMACLQGQAEADAFAAALARVQRYAIRGEVLELADAEGATLLRLHAAP